MARRMGATNRDLKKTRGNVIVVRTRQDGLGRLLRRSMLAAAENAQRQPARIALAAGPRRPPVAGAPGWEYPILDS